MSNFVITNLVISSSALELDANKTRGGLSLSNSMILPQQCYGRVLNAFIWNDHPNIIAPNNKVTLTYDNVLYTLTFEEGLYGSVDLQERLTELLTNATLPSNLLVLQPDEATGKFSLKNERSALTLSINFEVDNYILKELCGFSGVLNNPVTSTWLEGTNRASLNVINSYLIHANFVQSGWFNGISGSNVAASVQINVSPSQIINYEPRHPLVYAITETEIDTIFIYLTDENNNPVKTNENWSVTFEFFTQ